MSEDNKNLEFLVGKAIRGDLRWEPVLIAYNQDDVVDYLLDEQKCLKSKALMQQSAIEELAEILDIWQLCRLYLWSGSLSKFCFDKHFSVFGVVADALFFNANRFNGLPLDEKVALYKYLTETVAPLHFTVPDLLWDMTERLPWPEDVAYLVVAVNNLTASNGEMAIPGDNRETAYGSYRALRRFLPQAV